MNWITPLARPARPPRSPYAVTSSSSFGSSNWQSPVDLPAHTNSSAGGVNALHAVRFYTYRGLRLSDLAVYVVTGATGAVMRQGVYTEKAGDIYPDQLIADFGEISNETSAAVAGYSGLDVWLESDSFVWFVYARGTAAAVLKTLLGGTGHSMSPLLGFNSSHLRCVGLVVARSYASLPATFPTGATGVASNGLVPVPMVKFSEVG
jgi:hypothetical protein